MSHHTQITTEIKLDETSACVNHSEKKELRLTTKIITRNVRYVAFLV